MENQEITKLGRKTFSRAGWSLSVIIFVTSLLTLTLSLIFKNLEAAGMGPGILHSSLFRWAISYIPVYGVAFPLCMWSMHSLPADPGVKKKMKASAFLIGFIMCFPMMLGGNILGTLLAGLLSGGRSQNNVVEMINLRDPLLILTMLFAAPILEELVFRKWIIDRTVRFGEKNAILFSALAFGLFHCNLYQFFYALGIGLLFGYFYVRTRDVRYTMLMHFMINFLSGVVAAALMSLVDPEILSGLLSGDQEMLTAMLSDPEKLSRFFLSYIPLMLQGFLNMGLAVAGIVLLGLKNKEFRFLPAPQELPGGSRVKTVYLNAGVLFFILLSLAETVMNLLGTIE